MPLLPACGTNVSRAAFCPVFITREPETMKRLIPPDDCPEEIARRLDVIQQHRALNAILGVNPDAMSQAEQHQQQRRRGEPIGPCTACR